MKRVRRVEHVRVGELELALAPPRIGAFGFWGALNKALPGPQPPTRRGRSVATGEEVDGPDVDDPGYLAARTLHHQRLAILALGFCLEAAGNEEVRDEGEEHLFGVPLEMRDGHVDIVLEGLTRLGANDAELVALALASQRITGVNALSAEVEAAAKGFQ